MFLKKILIFLGLIPSTIRKFGPKIIDILDDINNFLDSTEVKIIVSLTANKYDDAVRLLLVKAITAIRGKTKLITDCAGLTTPSEIIQCFIEQMKDLSELDRTTIMGLVHSEAMKIADGNKDRTVLYNLFREVLLLKKRSKS